MFEQTFNNIDDILHKDAGSTFEEYACEQDSKEYWLNRELQELLGYTDWRNFLNAVDKAKESCKTSGGAVSDYFVDVSKMIKIGCGPERRQNERRNSFISI